MATDTLERQPRIEDGPLGPDEGELNIMGGQTGHLTLRWNRRNKDDVENARKTFRDLHAKGYSAFSKEGGRIDTFDPDAREVTIVAPMAGGGA